MKSGKIKTTIQLNPNETIEVEFFVTDISFDEINASVVNGGEVTLTGRGKVVTMPATAELKDEAEQLFYVQDATDTVGGVMLWLKLGDDGYACDIRKARKFTRAEIVEMDIIGKKSKCVWPVEYIDERIKHYIDERDCRMDSKQNYPFSVNTYLAISGAPAGE